MVTTRFFKWMMSNDLIWVTLDLASHYIMIGIKTLNQLLQDKSLDQMIYILRSHFFLSRLVECWPVGTVVGYSSASIVDWWMTFLRFPFFEWKDQPNGESRLSAFYYHQPNNQNHPSSIGSPVLCHFLRFLYFLRSLLPSVKTRQCLS